MFDFEYPTAEINAAALWHAELLRLWSRTVLSRLKIQLLGLLRMGIESSHELASCRHDFQKIVGIRLIDRLSGAVNVVQLPHLGNVRIAASWLFPEED